jgi:hypothetical protein
MSRAGVAQQARRRVEDGADDGRQVCAVRGPREPVELRQHLGGSVGDECNRSQRAAQLGHDRRGLQAAADDVTDGDCQPAAADLEGVVPVTADLHSVSARLVAHRARHTLDAAVSDVQQADLQRA